MSTSSVSSIRLGGSQLNAAFKATNTQIPESKGDNVVVKLTDATQIQKLGFGKDVKELEVTFAKTDLVNKSGLIELKADYSVTYSTLGKLQSFVSATVQSAEGGDKD